jgi:hypothetical protein
MGGTQLARSAPVIGNLSKFLSYFLTFQHFIIKLNPRHHQTPSSYIIQAYFWGTNEVRKSLLLIR